MQKINNGMDTVWCYSFWIESNGKLNHWKTECDCEDYGAFIKVSFDTNRNWLKIKKSNFNTIHQGRNVFMETPNDELAKQLYIKYFEKQIKECSTRIDWLTNKIKIANSTTLFPEV